MAATQTETMSKRHQIAVLVFLLGFAALCYATVIPTYFVSDDFILIGRVAEEGMFYAHADNGKTALFLRPGTTLAYLFDYHVWGLNPIGYHLTNIFFHGLTGYLVFLFARHLLRLTNATRTWAPAVLAAALFLALPCHSESVSWISGRTDVIAVAFGLGSTLCFAVLIQRGSVLMGLLALLLLWAALLTKECAIVLPVIWLVFFALDWFLRKQRASRHSIAVISISFLCLPVYLLIRRAVIGQFLGGYGASSHFAFLNPSLADGRHVLQFVLRTFLPPCPLKLQSFMDHPLSLPCVGFVAGVAVSQAIVYRKSLVNARWVLPGALAISYFVGLVLAIRQPVSLTETFSERFLYLPSIFACIWLVYAVTSLISSPRKQTAILAALIVMEAASLQWVNTRWVTASRLCQEIALEVSKADPAHAVVLNVPDNFRGAYVFRNGLSQAATLFQGRPLAGYRVVSVHSLGALPNLCETQVEPTGVTVTFPPFLQYTINDERGFNIEKRDHGLRLTYLTDQSSQVTSLLSFQSGASKPMLRVVDRRTIQEAESATRF